MEFGQWLGIYGLLLLIWLELRDIRKKLKYPARKTMPYMRPLRLKGPLMTRIAVSILKTVTFILGIVLTSCFIGRGANSRMKHVVGIQQRFIARRDRKINRW